MNRLLVNFDLDEAVYCFIEEMNHRVFTLKEQLFALDIGWSRIVEKVDCYSHYY